MQHNMNIGDKYYCVHYHDVMRIFSLPIHRSEVFYKIQWERYDENRFQWVNPEDGFISDSSIEMQSLNNLPLIKFETEQELLQLKLKYA